MKTTSAIFYMYRINFFSSWVPIAKTNYELGMNNETSKEFTKALVTSDPLKIKVNTVV